MKTIELTQGKSALVDDIDFKWLSKWKWCAERLSQTTTQERWRVKRPIWKGKSVYMARAIAERAGFPKSQQIDHEDGDGLNNCRSNLRPCTQQENVRNRSKRLGLTSKFKGVCWFKPIKKWRAYIFANGKQYSLGYYDNEIEAAQAYDWAAPIHFGEFAKLNFP